MKLKEEYINLIHKLYNDFKKLEVLEVLEHSYIYKRDDDSYYLVIY